VHNLRICFQTDYSKFQTKHYLLYNKWIINNNKILKSFVKLNIHGTKSPCLLISHDVFSSSLIDSKCKSKVKTVEKYAVGARSLVRSTSGVEGHARVPGWGLGRLTSNSITHMDLHESNNKLVSV
jgi:hypothetical protein